MLVLSRKPNQNVRIGDHITVSIVRIKGNVVQLGIEAPADVRILRSELIDRQPSPQDGPDLLSMTPREHEWGACHVPVEPQSKAPEPEDEPKQIMSLRLICEPEGLNLSLLGKVNGVS